MRPTATVVAVTAVAMLVAPPVLAHPFGPPPTARISAEGSQLVIDWVATPDDAVAIGEQLGLMPEGSVAAYRQDSAAQVAPSSAAEARLSASPDLHRHLTEHITVTQDGRQCESQVAPVADFVHRGARIEVTCPHKIQTVSLRISLLHDLHEAYRTVGIGAASNPPRAVFTVAAPEHDMTFGAAAAPARSTAVVAAVAGGAVLLVITLLLRRRRR